MLLSNKDFFCILYCFKMEKLIMLLDKFERCEIVFTQKFKSVTWNKTFPQGVVLP